MIQNFDIFNKPEMPSIILCNPSKTELYSISGVISNTNLVLRFNALSEFSFNIPSTIDNGVTWIESYDYIQAKRLINIEGIGYFIIDNVEEITEGQNPIKVVKTKSLEAEMLNKRFNSFTGTYKFYNLIPVSSQTTFMDSVLSLLPTWSSGYVDLDVAKKYRTFEINDSTAYGVLMNDCEKAYECIFSFDSVAKTINVYGTSNATTPTDIYLSYENLIKNSSFTELSDEICTALYVTGDGSLDIRAVNPLGTNVIYDFTYYKNTDWMSSGLVTAVTNWENAVLAAQPIYAGYLTSLRTKNQELIDLNIELGALQGNYTAKELQLKTAIQAGLPTSTINSELQAIGLQITAKEGEITAKQAEITSLTGNITAINISLSFPVNFTTDEFKELSEFIFENSYQNNTLVVTDLTTTVEYQDTAQELYDQALVVLGKASLPRYEFKMDTANFIAMKEFKPFTDQVVLGCTVTVNVNDKYTVTPVLLEIQMSYDDPTNFSLTFSNRLRLDNGNFQYSDLMGQTISTASTVSGNTSQWSNWDHNYKDTVSEFITSALDASRNAVINATNQEITISEVGLRGKQYLPDTDTYDPNQVWMTSNLIAFTPDNWDTSSLALGKIEWNGNTVFGLVASVIAGQLVASNTLQITNEGSNFILDENGAVLNNASFTIQNPNNAIVLTPNETTVNGIVSQGISIQSHATGSWENVFYTDVEGNLVLKGGITASFGDIGGWHIRSNGLYDDFGNYINSDGNVKLGGLSLTPSTARFTGDLYATRLFGRVVGAGNYMAGSIVGTIGGPIKSLYADLINAGTMVADRIYGGIFRGPGGIEISLGNTPGQGHFKANNGISLEIQGLPGSGIRVTKNYNILNGQTYSGPFGFNSTVSVKKSGKYLLGKTANYTIGTTQLKFVNGILIGGTGTGSGGGEGGIGGEEIPAGGSILIWDRAIINGTDVVTSAFADHPCTIPSVSSGKAAYIIMKLGYTGDASTKTTLYGINSAGDRVVTGAFTPATTPDGLTYVYFNNYSPVLVTGFELYVEPGDPGWDTSSLLPFAYDGSADSHVINTGYGFTENFKTSSFNFMDDNKRLEIIFSLGGTCGSPLSVNWAIRAKLASSSGPGKTWAVIDWTSTSSSGYPVRLQRASGYGFSESISFSGTKLIYDGPDIFWINDIDTSVDYYSPGTYTSEGVINYFYSATEPVFVSRILRIGQSKIFNA